MADELMWTRRSCAEGMGYESAKVEVEVMEAEAGQSSPLTRSETGTLGCDRNEKKKRTRRTRWMRKRWSEFEDRERKATRTMAEEKFARGEAREEDDPDLESRIESRARPCPRTSSRGREARTEGSP